MWGEHNAKIVGKYEPMWDPQYMFSLPALSPLLSLAVHAGHKLWPWQHSRPLLSLKGDLCLLPTHILVLTLIQPKTSGTCAGICGAVEGNLHLGGEKIV